MADLRIDTDQPYQDKTQYVAPDGTKFLWWKDAPVEEAAAKFQEFQQGPPTLGSTVTRGYQNVARPLTKAASVVADVATEPLVAMERVAQGEPLPQVVGSYVTPEQAVGLRRRATTPEQAANVRQQVQRSRAQINPFAEVAVPQSPVEAAANVGAIAGGPFGPAGRIGASALLAEIANQLEGGTSGMGALLGGGATLGGEAAAPVISSVRRALPGAKSFIERDDTQRVGRHLGVGTTATDIADATTGAVTRTKAVDAQNAAAMDAHRAAIKVTRQQAADATRAGRADRAAEWQRRLNVHQREMATFERASQEAAVEAGEATAGLRTTAERMRGAVNERRHGEAVENVRGAITRVSPQFGGILDAPGERGLYNAASGRAKAFRANTSMEMVKTLEQAVPAGIVVPSLGEEPVSVVQAIQALRDAGPRGQYKTELDRTAAGQAARVDRSTLRQEIADALDTYGVGDVFRSAQALLEENFAISKTVLRNENFGPRGEFSVEKAVASVGKPKARAELEKRLGPERYQDLAGTLLAQPQPLGPQPTPRLTPRDVGPRPANPTKPMRVAGVQPDLPEPPQPITPQQIDVVMTELFGGEGRLLQRGKETVVNWPAVQKAMQKPATRAKLTDTLGRDGYVDLLRKVLRGAERGADVPAKGSGQFLGPLRDVASGRDPGGGAFATSGVRAFLPNLGAEYVGKKPLDLPAGMRSLLDIIAQRTAIRGRGDQ